MPPLDREQPTFEERRAMALKNARLTAGLPTFFVASYLMAYAFVSGEILITIGGLVFVIACSMIATNLRYGAIIPQYVSACFERKEIKRRDHHKRMYLGANQDRIFEKLHQYFSEYKYIVDGRVFGWKMDTVSTTNYRFYGTFSYQLSLKDEDGRPVSLPRVAVLEVVFFKHASGTEVQFNWTFTYDPVLVYKDCEPFIETDYHHIHLPRGLKLLLDSIYTTLDTSFGTAVTIEHLQSIEWKKLAPSAQPSKNADAAALSNAAAEDRRKSRQELVALSGMAVLGFLIHLAPPIFKAVSDQASTKTDRTPTTPSWQTPISSPPSTYPRSIPRPIIDNTYPPTSSTGTTTDSIPEVGGLQNTPAYSEPKILYPSPS